MKPPFATIVPNEVGLLTVQVEALDADERLGKLAAGAGCFASELMESINQHFAGGASQLQPTGRAFTRVRKAAAALAGEVQALILLSRAQRMHKERGGRAS